MLGMYLPINFFNMVINPILQLLIVLLVITMAAAGFSPIQLNLLNLILWFGLGWAFFYRNLLHRPRPGLERSTLLLCYPALGALFPADGCRRYLAIILELRKAETKWNKKRKNGRNFRQYAINMVILNKNIS